MRIYNLHNGAPGVLRVLRASTLHVHCFNVKHWAPCWRCAPARAMTRAAGAVEKYCGAPATNSNQALPAGEKLRILCLHGYQQSGEVGCARRGASAPCAQPPCRWSQAQQCSDDEQVFSSRIGSVRKALRSRADFHFVDAPTLARPEPGWASETNEKRPVGRTWWEWTVRLLCCVACISAD